MLFFLPLLSTAAVKCQRQPTNLHRPISPPIPIQIRIRIEVRFAGCDPIPWQPKPISSSFVSLSRVESVAFQWQVRAVSLSTHQSVSPSVGPSVPAMAILNHNCCRPRLHYTGTYYMVYSICAAAL